MSTLNQWRSSHRWCSLKKGVLRNFAKFIGKHICQRLFSNKVAGLRRATSLRKSFWYRCFPVNSAKFLRTAFFAEHFWTNASDNGCPEEFLYAFRLDAVIISVYHSFVSRH